MRGGIISRLPIAVALALTSPAVPRSGAAAAGPPPGASVTVHPGEDVAGIVARSAAGTQFRFAAGTYRLLELIPKDGDSFSGRPGAILSGAQIVSGFRRNGALYAAPANLQPRPAHPGCQPGRDCGLPNDVFVDGQRQEPVQDAHEVGPGRVFIDYKGKRLYLGTDPAGKTVELATARYAFAGRADDVRIAGLVIEKYANAAQTGAIGGDGTPARWTIEHCEIRYNHGVGIEIGDDGRVSDSFIHHNGQLGIGGRRSHLVIADNQISDNNQAGFDTDWEAGGVKITRAIHAVIKGNFVHGNHGPGLWADIDSIDTVYDGNRIDDNDGPGIQHEISFDAEIENNRLRGNGKMPHRWVWDAQILVQNSRGVEVRDNRVAVPPGGYGIILVEQQRERGPFGPHLVRDCAIAHNVIAMEGDSGIVAGIATDYGESRAAQGGNRFDADTYRVPDADGRFWAWPSWEGNLSFSDFRRRSGQEAAGTLTVGRAAPARP